MKVHGIHHLTAVSARIRENHRFYTGVLGMRLVKRSVNQDDVSAYHLFYADGVGTPGTDITFFDWAVGPERRGTHSIARTFLRVRDRGSVEWWKGRLADQGVAAGEVEERDGRATLLFQDPEGQRLGVVADEGTGDPPTPWEESPVPAEHQIRGLGPILLSVPDPDPTDRVLVAALGMKAVRRYRAANGEGTEADTLVYSMDGHGPHAELHVAVEPHLPVTRPGAGGVHHVAFRIRDEEYDAWAAELNRLGIPNSGQVDRYYFRSLYFREPNGILFELATDGPGFAVDEDPATLGEELALPPFLEARRREITAGLKPID
jgi:glyoxalase family protein